MIGAVQCAEALVQLVAADVDGHNMNPVISQHLARAREQDIQRNLATHEAREASRPHKK